MTLKSVDGRLHAEILDRDFPEVTARIQADRAGRIYGAACPVTLVARLT
jgi:hypothetical protein